MVLEKLKKIINEQLDINTDDITMDSVIVDDFGADSLDLVDILMSIEDEFNLEVSDEEVQKIKTVGDLVHYIEENI